MLAAVSVGAIAAVSEYGSGLIRTTTVAVPARGAVVLAKAVVQAVLWTVVGSVVALCSFSVAQAILSGRDAAISSATPTRCGPWPRRRCSPRCARWSASASAS